jgi:WD40 repeat protein
VRSATFILTFGLTLLYSAGAASDDKKQPRLDLNCEPLPQGALVRLGQPIFEEKPIGVNSVAWSPDGKFVASASDDRMVHLWDSATGKEIRSCAGHQDRVRCVAWSPDGNTLASASEDKTIRLWNPSTGKDVRSCVGHEDWVTYVAWSADSKTLASASSDRTVRLWDAATGKQIRSFTGHKEGVSSVSWSPDCKAFASASLDNTVRLWESATGKEIHCWVNHEGWVSSVAWSADGNALASASYDNTVRLWHPATGKQIRASLEHDFWVYCVSWSPDGKTVASAGAFPGIQVWDPAAGKHIRTLPDVPRSIVKSLAFSPDGLRLASANSDGTVLIWEVASVSMENRKVEGLDLSGLWSDLESKDPLKADRALWKLVAASEQSIPFLRKHLVPAKRDAELMKKLDKLVGELDHEEYAIRETASAELAKMGLRAEPALRKALSKAPTLEVRRRIEAIAEPLETNLWPGIPLQDWRALAVLERIGSDDARGVLERLSKGEPNDCLTEEATVALERLRKLKAARGK